MTNHIYILVILTADDGMVRLVQYVGRRGVLYIGRICGSILGRGRYKSSSGWAQFIEAYAAYRKDFTPVLNLNVDI